MEKVKLVLTLTGLTLKSAYISTVLRFFILDMGKMIDLTGQRFGQLLVVKYIGLDRDGKRSEFECLCDCGITVNKTGYTIKKAKELYCGPMHPTKACTKCKIEKQKSTDFHKNKIGLQSVCKQCKSEFYIDNAIELREKYHKSVKDNPTERERIRKKNKASWLRNKHKELAYKREYNKRPEVIEHRKKIHQQRKETDIEYNIKRRLRWRVRDAVKRVNGKGYKYKSSLVLLGCDMDTFKRYIESKFQYGMNWERFAYIHIDHIVPCNHFDLTKYEDQKVCFHYTNLQPLWEVDNLIKGRKYDPNLINNP